MSDNKPYEIDVPTKGNSLELSNTNSIDLTGLSDSQAIELKKKFAENRIDLDAKTQEMRIGVAALNATLESFNSNAEKATQAGHSATFQHSQTTSLGRTEIIVGNTDKAASGKLNRSATGEANNTILIAVILGIAAIVVALILK